MFYFYSYFVDVPFYYLSILPVFPVHLFKYLMTNGKSSQSKLIIDYFIMDKINHWSLLHEHYFSLPAMIIHHAISNKKCLEDQSLSHGISGSAYLLKWVTLPYGVIINNNYGILIPSTSLSTSRLLCSSSIHSMTHFKLLSSEAYYVYHLIAMIMQWVLFTNLDMWVIVLHFFSHVLIVHVVYLM